MDDRRSNQNDFAEFDAAVGAALRDVPVPSDLADRLLMAVKAVANGERPDPQAFRVSLTLDPAANAMNPLAANSQATLASRSAREPAAKTPSVRHSRRTWLGVSVAAALAVAAGIGGFLLYPWPPEFVTSEEIAEQVNGLFEGLGPHRDPSSAGLLSDHNWHAGAPVSSDPWFENGSLPPPRRWCDLEIGRRAATAYDLTAEAEGAVRATLFVIRRPVQGLELSPPATPQATTHGRCIGVWRSDTDVYVLVVEGSTRDYEQLVSSQAIT